MPGQWLEDSVTQAIAEPCDCAPSPFPNMLVQTCCKRAAMQAVYMGLGAGRAANTVHLQHA